MTRVFRVVVRRTGGENTAQWIAEVPELPDCAVSGGSFEELETGLRERIRELSGETTASPSTATGVSAGSTAVPVTAVGTGHSVELQWSLDETGG